MMARRRIRAWVTCPDLCRDGLLHLADGSVAVCGTCDGLGRITTLARPGRLPGILVTALVVGIAWFLIGLLVGRASVSGTPPTVWVAVPASAFAALPSLPSIEPAPALLIPTATPTAKPKPTTKPKPAPRPTGPSVRVTVTYYCNLTHPEARQSRCSRGHPDVAGDQLYAAVSPDLPWRGKVVLVCARGSCVPVLVIDCNCQATRALDLYADAFLALAPLSAGRITATATVQR